MAKRASMWFRLRRDWTLRKSLYSFRFPLRTIIPSLRCHTHLPTSKIYILLILIILVSTGGGVVYAVVKDDTSTGLTISTYVLMCLGLIVAVVAAGQWLGLTKPDSFSFAYDVDENLVLSAPRAGSVFGPDFGVVDRQGRVSWL
jgi:hypothetical protein